MVTRRAGHTPATGPPTKEMKLMSDQIAMQNEIKNVMQALGLDKDWILQGTDAAKPAAGVQNRIYIATDATKKLYIDNGSSWVQIV